MPKLLYGWSNKEMRDLQLPIIAEMWKRVMGTGSGKRKLRAEFSEEEINKIHTLYDKVKIMHLKAFAGQGTPNRHIMSVQDYNFARRVVHFFATFT